ncbi:MAG: dephospho-CoA kinase [Chthoniobacteraceae bacterium]
MPVIGLTGGIATGKSTFTRCLREQLPMEHFDSDACVHGLLAADDSVRDAIVAAFGREACDEAGRPDRAKLRSLVFDNETRRKTLENILHPIVRTRWTKLADTARARGEWLLTDVPLLYETGAAAQFDRVIVVACHRDTQLSRLTRERGLAPELARRIMQAQLDLGEKIQKADHVIWNDSTVPNLDGQTRILAACLRRHFA